MYMTKGTGASNFTTISGKSYTASGLVDNGDVREALRNGWTPNDLGSGVTVASDFTTSTVAAASAVSLVSATAKTVTSIVLTQGNWDVTGVVDFTPGATTTITLVSGSVSLTTNTLSSQAGGSGLGTDPTSSWAQPSGAPGANTLSLEVDPVRLSIDAQTTVYLVAQATFATSTLSAYGTISARRVK